MKDLLTSVINIGIDESVPVYEAKIVQIQNQLGCITLLLLSVFVMFFCVVKMPMGVVFNVVMIAHILVSFVLNYHKKFILSRFLAIILSYLVLGSAGVLFGDQSGYHFGILLVLVLPILYFRERKYRIITYALITVIGLLTFYIFKDKVPLFQLPNYMEEIKLAMFICCSALLVAYSTSSDSINKMYEERNIELVDKLTHRNEELANFSYTTSHDLKQPLRTILNFVGLLKQSFTKKENSEEILHLNFIENAGQRLDNLINALLNHSILGKSDKNDRFNCTVLVENVLTDLQQQINENEAIVKVNKLPTIVGCRDEIRIVFQNLISNAIKFKRKKHKPVVEISYKDHPLFWQFDVKDNGQGIGKASQKKIFGIFQRGFSQKEIKGTGIGLANCKKIVEYHKGEIWVKSEENKGSVFSFTIEKKPI